MKSKILLLLFAFVCVAACASGCASCASYNDGNEQTHTHTYDREKAEQKYLKSAATCLNPAEYFYSCECGQSGEETFFYGQSGEHAFKSYISDDNATCTENCTQTAACVYCGETDTREIADSSLGHSFTSYISDDNATCIKLCTETAKCGRCDATDTRNIPNSKLKHVFVNYIPDNNATCVKDGTATATCENCRRATDSIIIKGRLGHSFVNYVSNDDATCTDNGTETATCERCGKTDVREIADSALGHNVVKYQSQNNATCTKNCTEIGACTRCLEIDIREIPDSKLAHNFVNYVSDLNGTCTTNCTETAKCEYCTATDTREKEDSKIHSYVGRFCKLCGKEYYTQGLEYKLNNDGVSYCFTGKGTATDTDVYIPSMYNGLPVTEIAENAFYYQNKFKNVFIPHSITNINDNMFLNTSTCTFENITVDENNENYKSVDGNLYSKDGTKLLRYSAGKKETLFEIPKGVTDIGASAFFNASWLTKITIPSGVTRIEVFTFYGCKKLTDIIIPNGVTSIGDYAFKYCESLKTVTIPKSVTYIKREAFSMCSSLESITVDEDNQDYMSIDGNLYSKDGIKLLRYPAGKKEALFEIPESVKIIDNNAFYGCEHLTGVVVPENVTTIEYNFQDCGKPFIIYYKGTYGQWNEIEKSLQNIKDIFVFFYSVNPPENRGNYWRYNYDGTITRW